MAHFDHCGDGTEDEGTFYSLSTEYSEAARILMDTHPTKIKYSSVINYLLGHSAELALKGYLFKNGETVEDLIRVGHNLDRLIELAREKGIIQDGLESISDLSPIYKSKDLEYRKNEKASLPTQDQLLMDVQALQRTVFGHIAQQ